MLGDDPHLVAKECTSCGARFFDRRNACASCFATEFKDVDIATTGELQGVHDRGLRRPRRARCPFVAGVVDCDGTSVRGNVINTEPDPEHVTLGMKVKLATYAVGTDDDGTEAIGFGFEPLEA